MSRARDKANSTVSNFASTGIDDNADANAITIDSSENVGIGATDPNRGSHDRALLVSNTGSGARSAIEIEGNSSNANGTVTFLNNGTSAASIDNRGSGTLTFNTGSSLTERLRIQAGGGISFNGDTASANALSDYEEGTWTVTVGSGITNPSYNSQTGSYVKIGSLVIASFNMDTASGGTRNGDQMRFDGLPYAKKGSDPSEGGYITYEASFYSPGSMPYLGNSSSGFVFHKPDGNALNGTALSSANFICRGTIIYRAS